MSNGSNDTREVAANLTAEHYQHTYEITYEFWKQRNRLFVFLLLTIGLSMIFALENSDNQSTILKLIADFFGTESETYVTELADSFVVAFLQTILLIAVFFLMFNLYHRSVTVLRNYQYLGQVEDELRRLLNFDDFLFGRSVAYTREGEFYWNRRKLIESQPKWSRARFGGLGQKWAKGVYIFLVAVLLIPFLYLSLKTDYIRLSANNPFVTQGGFLAIIVLGVDLIIALLTLFYFVSYCLASVWLDTDDPTDDTPSSSNNGNRENQDNGGRTQEENITEH